MTHGEPERRRGEDPAGRDMGERVAPPAMTSMDSHHLEVDLHQLDLRFAASRLVDPQAVARIAQSIERCGQIVPCIVVAPPGGVGAGSEPPVLIDGYRRVAALRRLGRDTASVEQWTCGLAEAVLGVLARAQDRSFASIEEALLLRELMQGQGLSQHDLARRCGRDASWVSRRLQLLSGLPDAALAAVRTGKLSSLGGQPGGGAVGACQCRTCRQPAGGAGRVTAVDPRVAVLVHALPAGRANGARTHGRRSPPVSRRPAGE